MGIEDLYRLSLLRGGIIPGVMMTYEWEYYAILSYGYSSERYRRQRGTIFPKVLRWFRRRLRWTDADDRD